MELKNAKQLKGTVSIPGDKSISHRAIMFGSISNGITEITNFLQGADCFSTISCFQKMGIEIENTADRVIVYGKGLHGLSTPTDVLDVGNSGTTTRLISGILAGQSFSATLNGDASIQTRPMKRIITPLSQMGADIRSLKGNDCAPLEFHPAKLKGITYNSPVASAQVKSCILLAGLYADGTTTVTEPVLSRNHTELMLRAFGADISSKASTASIQPNPVLEGLKIEVPGDISSAAYFIAAGLLVPNSEILIKNVGINPTRDGILKVALAMGGNITKENERIVSGESVCDLLVCSSSLKGTTVEGELIPALIDEIPMIAVMAAFAEGTTIIRDAAELKVKESNRIETVADNLKRMGADVETTEDGMIIRGGKVLHPCEFDSYLDHRIAMSFAVGALALDKESSMKDAECVNISYPKFYEELYKLAK
ncbi:MAG: 3-phosphoshikimate 1-carboxyvinyltransferase [Lachnospiraceae bacterium]|nr:3-phosphoshikimate 1-carboxyvinyltransferase [Lachnospiraceae bacterium]